MGGAGRTRLRPKVEELQYYQHKPHEADEGRHETEEEEGAGGARPGETPEEREDREEREAAFATGSTSLHLAAARGDLSAVEREIERLDARGGSGTSIDATDANNWRPLHEAARGGHLEVVKKLVDAGADLGATTFQGGTPLWWARETHGQENEVVRFLREIGAPDFSEGDEL